MGKYALRRLSALVPVWLLISILAFMLIHMSPASPAALLLGGAQAPPAAIVRLTREMGLDRPLPVQYAIWLGHVLRGDWGISYFQHAPVLPTILKHADISAGLALLGLFFALAIGISSGVISAVRQGSALDMIVTAASTLGLSMPEFWLAMMLILLLAINLRIMPALGFVHFTRSPTGWFMHALLPAFTIGFVQSAPIARITRSSLLETMQADYVRTARSKGLTERTIIFRHALRTSLLPVLTVIGIVVVLLMSGDFVVEIVFAIPGLGQLLLNATLNHDYPLVQGGVLFLGSVVMLINLAVDLAYAVVDPRVSYD